VRRVRDPMKLSAWIILGLSALVFPLFAPGKKQAQRLFLRQARVGDSVTWADVFHARKVIAENEPGSKCIRISREHGNGQNVLYVFTLLQLYELRQDTSGEWRLISKGPYNY
jgi:hypothetical protein